jgi:hypothetical protein
MLDVQKIEPWSFILHNHMITNLWRITDTTMTSWSPTYILDTLFLFTIILLPFTRNIISSFANVWNSHSGGKGLFNFLWELFNLCSQVTKGVWTFSRFVGRNPFRCYLDPMIRFADLLLALAFGPLEGDPQLSDFRMEGYGSSLRRHWTRRRKRR